MGVYGLFDNKDGHCFDVFMAKDYKEAKHKGEELLNTYWKMYEDATVKFIALAEQGRR